MSSRSMVSFFRKDFSTSTQPVGEQPSPVLLHGGGQTGCAYAEGDHLVVLIHDETGGVGVDQRREFGSILLICSSVRSTVPYSGA